MNTKIIKVGKNITRLRKENQLSQKDLADLLYINPKTINNWEQNKSLPNIETLIMLSDIFNTDINNILGLKKENTKKLNTEYKKQALKKSLINLSIITILLIIPILYFVYSNNNIINILKESINNNLLISKKDLNIIKNCINSSIINYFTYIIKVSLIYIFYKKNYKYLISITTIYLLITNIYTIYNTNHFLNLIPIIIPTILSIIISTKLWKKYIQKKNE